MLKSIVLVVTVPCAGKNYVLDDAVGIEPSIDAFMEVSKSGGRDLATKSWHHCKHNTTLSRVNEGNRHAGPLSRVVFLLNTHWSEFSTYALNYRAEHNVYFCST